MSNDKNKKKTIFKKQYWEKKPKLNQITRYSGYVLG